MQEAGLTIIHVEESPKPMEFEPWADRMGCTPETKTELRRLLDTAPAEANDFFNPHNVDSKLWFSIRESIIIAKKS